MKVRVHSAAVSADIPEAMMDNLITEWSIGKFVEEWNTVFRTGSKTYS